eukprot:CAMPEP_0179346882 /NCGR_PEP_ID=MMETSP0797-20121207/72811_1 /TAXON_ID=47934 /ORGANISM="Dinophysis acuminata, Strain DAEP01" /LENGTH=30 /DNA_ID= /DNA_START= /DNA_END= /DNA_ORIENTATION=
MSDAAGQPAISGITKSLPHKTSDAAAAAVA